MCQLILAIRPNKPLNPEKDLFLCIERAMQRLEPDLNIYPFKVRNKHENYIYLSQQKHDFSGSTGLQRYYEVSNAIGRVSSFSKSAKAMQLRLVNSSSVDVALVRSWIQLCESNHHESCEVLRSSALSSIYLLDVRTRQIVSYPHKNTPRYLCLSYPWGTRPQRIIKFGAFLVKATPLIEDAITFVRRLRERYLWIYSVCDSIGLYVLSRNSLMKRRYVLIR